MTNKLFYIYLSLYPGKADVIHSAISRGIEKADMQCLEGKERQDCIECEILDALD